MWHNQNPRLNNYYYQLTNIMSSISERQEKSRRGEICGVIDCKDNPVSNCPECGEHFCYQHISLHRDIVSNEDFIKDAGA